MNITEAAQIFMRDQPIVDAIMPELTEAKKILKARFRRRSTAYHGITYSAVPFTYLDVALARDALGARKTAKCTMTSEREFLTLPPHLRRGAIDLSPLLQRTG